MTKLSLVLIAAAMVLPAVCSAAEYVEPTQFCHESAEAAYLQAVAQGDGLPDTMYNRVQEWCLADAWRAHLAASPEYSLNELIAFDIESERAPR